MRKLRKKDVLEEWRDEGGYWIVLRAGLKSADDPVGAMHEIHAETKKEAWATLIIPCRCRECLQDGHAHQNEE